MDSRIKNIICCHLLFLCSGILHGQDKPEYAVSRIDTALIKNARAVIRFEETRYIISSPREYIHQTTKVVTLFDKNSNEAVVGVPYNKYSHAELISATIYDASGALVRRIKNSEIDDRALHDDYSLFLDQRAIGFRSFGGQLPYTLEYQWQIKYHQTNYYPEWQPVDKEESIEKATFILEAPADLIVHFKTLNYNFDHTSATSSGKQIQTWRITNKVATVEEESGPPDIEILPVILFSPSVFQVEGFTGSMTDWKSFGSFLYELNKGRDQVTPEMATLIHSMTKDCKTPFEKIDTLYHWLQHNMRYVSVQIGIGGWQTFDAAYVEKNKYGDCKALSNFMKGMLKEVGIESFEVSINADEEDHLFFNDFVYPAFNHAMLMIPQENMWLECTSNYKATGTISKDEENKTVLLATPDGGKIVNTPHTASNLNQIFSIDTVWIAEQTKIKGEHTYQGNTQEDVTGMFYYLAPEEQKKYFLEKMPLSVQKLNQFQITCPKSGEQSSINYSAILNQFGSLSGNRYFIPVNAIYPPSPACSSSTNRKTDFISKDDFTETNDMYIAMPGDYLPEYIPVKAAYDFQGNHFLLEATKENQFIHVHQQVVETPMRLSPDQYGELCTFRSAVAKACSQKMVFKKM